MSARAPIAARAEQRGAAINTISGYQLADLELRHRRHTRVEDRIRNGKGTGLHNLPYHDLAQKQICWPYSGSGQRQSLTWH